jgi:5-formyltetrahydrofolate cyclo-ligase
LDGEDELRRRVKRELRKRALAVRKTTPADACAARSAAIVERAQRLEVLEKAARVALFWPIEDKHEVDLRALDLWLRGKGARVAYPALVPNADREERPRMTFHFTLAPSDLEVRGSTFAEPPHESAPVPGDLSGLDVVIVPALVIDPSGHRIGYGAGYYDRALAETRVIKVGVAFDFQLAPEIPVTPGDIPVDWVVTDRRVIRVGAD